MGRRTEKLDEIEAVTLEGILNIFNPWVIGQWA